MNILLSAYAISPNHGSEPGMGWNWMINIAKYHKLFVITEGEWSLEINSKLKELNLSDQVVVHYLPFNARIRKMCWNQGDWRFYLFYHFWQYRALTLAMSICKLHKIDLIHQLNMIGFREPGLLWLLDIPFVWGPVGGFGEIPFNYLKNASFQDKLKLMLKKFINDVQVYQPNVQLAIHKSKVIIASNSLTVGVISKFKPKELHLIHETANNISFDIRKKINNKTLTICWVGKNDFRKGLFIALEVFELLKAFDIKFLVIGVERPLGFTLNNVEFHSWLPREQVDLFLKISDVFLFTSLHEGTSTVVMEALSYGLPVLCHDTCGQGDVINDTCGQKVPLGTIKQSVAGFYNSILYLYNNREKLLELSNGAVEMGKIHTWYARANSLNLIYNEIVNNKN